MLALAVFGVMVLDTTAVIGLLVPSDAVLLTASAAAGPTGAPLVAAAAVPGTLIGCSLSWWLGTRFGAHIRSSRIGARSANTAGAPPRRCCPARAPGCCSSCSSSPSSTR